MNEFFSRIDAPDLIAAMDAAPKTYAQVDRQQIKWRGSHYSCIKWCRNLSGPRRMSDWYWARESCKFMEGLAADPAVEHFYRKVLPAIRRREERYH